MKEVFLAKDIQCHVGISFNRYVYMKAKGGISPDIRKAKNNGEKHKYSFKNLIQFAIAHHSNLLGLSFDNIRKMLTYIDEIDLRGKCHIFDAFAKPKAYLLHFTTGQVYPYFKITDKLPIADPDIFQLPTFSTINLGVIKERFLKKVMEDEQNDCVQLELPLNL